jgi:endonuclease/exonuclease/phosphatase family metal-dependent hydrolase
VLHDLRGYSTLYNIGTNSRGTAIIAREGITLVNLTRLPSGHAIAAKLDCSIINVYTSSRTAHRQDRETFYSCELPHVLTQESRNMLMAGDFNCTLEQGDSTGAMNHCRALTELLRGMELRDAWNRSADRPGYTHSSVNGASWLDRIYVT